MSRSSPVPGVSTLALHGPAASPDAPRRAGPLVGSIAQSTTFHQARVGEADGPTYSRVANPSVDECEGLIGALEGAPPAVAFGTGLGAETALFLTVLRAGDHAVVADSIYGGTTRLFRNVLSELGITSTFVDASDPELVQRAISPRTKAVFIETPANPTLRLTDIGAIAAITRSAGVRLVVDNTFLTPVLQRPLDLGADVCVASTTKLIEGHSTACGGVVTSRDEDLLDRVRWVRKCTGGIISPFNAWLTTRGVKTLPVRIRSQSRSALRIARWLAAHPGVERVNFPGLADFSQRELASRQHLEDLHGCVVSLEVKGGLEAGRRVLEGTRLCCLVEHVGSVETLLTHPATMTHADVPPDQRRAVGLTDGLIRLSVGLEDVVDIITDLGAAIDAATGVRSSRADELAKAIAEGGAR